MCFCSRGIVNKDSSYITSISLLNNATIAGIEGFLTKHCRFLIVFIDDVKYYFTIFKEFLNILVFRKEYRILN